MGYSDILEKNYPRDYRVFELTLLLVILDKYPELDGALRKDKPKKHIVDIVINHGRDFEVNEETK